MSSYDVVVESLVKRFKNVTAIDQVSFSIKKGQFFSLLGPSGCGKSTTLRALAGFIEPDEGNIIINGQVMNHVVPNRRPTNMVFQRLALFPHLTVAENITFGLRIKKMNKSAIKKKLDDALKLIRLSEYGERRINELSGGRQQRVAIARALINEPQVLLLDEPLGALDLQLRLQMQKELKRIQETVGTTFIYVTHDQSEALTMSDEIAIMNEGKIMQVSSPKEIYERPKNSFVAKFIGDTNLLQGHVIQKIDQFVKVHTKSGIEIIGEPNDIVEIDQKVNVSIRLEHIFINEENATEDNKFNGKIEDIIYQGDYTEYKISIKEHGVILDIFAKVLNSDKERNYGINEKITVSWKANKSIVLIDSKGE